MPAARNFRMVRLVWLAPALAFCRWAQRICSADRLFTALIDGGQVTMPLCQTFWSPRFGMAVDRFGVTWMINVQA
jgi:uncharacterized glyoxalase superfamily protein PhnB